jgi:growth arrest-specific protein 8
MELLEDNHRVELRVYQQKVKHLEYEHSNNMKDIVKDGTNWLDSESYSHDKRQVDMLKMKEQMKFQKMEMELVNASKVTEVRQLHEKQLIKLRQQFDEGLNELTTRCQNRLTSLESDLELQRRVEIHEVEERKNQHINELIRNHKKAFAQMKSYYNDITSGNLQLIKKLQSQVQELKDQAAKNKKSLIEYMEENIKLSEPLAKVTGEIAEMQGLLRERAKDQMALRNAHARLASLNKMTTTLKSVVKLQEEDYIKLELERDHLYNSFEDTIQRIQQQTDFQNQSLSQKLFLAETNSTKLMNQISEITSAANLDVHEMENVLSSLSQMMLAKEEANKQLKFNVIKAQKTFNDGLESVQMRLRELGIAEEEISAIGFDLEVLPPESTTGPASLLLAR